MEKKSPNFVEWSQNCGQNIKAQIESTKKFNKSAFERWINYKKHALKLLTYVNIIKMPSIK